MEKLSMGNDTKVHLRRLWLRVLITLFGAFAIIIAISLLSPSPETPAEEEPICDPPAFVCSLAQVEAWMGFQLPDGAEGVQYESDDTRNYPVLWLRFDAPAATVPNFLQNVGMTGTILNSPTSFIPRPEEGRLPWWQATMDMTGVISSAQEDRYFLIQLDQSDTERWVLYLSGIENVD